MAANTFNERRNAQERDARSNREPKRSWAELWALVGLDSDGKLSRTQADLVTDVYRPEKTLQQAVADHDLVEVYATGVPMGEQQAEVHVGYRLIGEVEEVDR